MVKTIILQIIRAVCNAYYLLIIARVIMSWIQVGNNAVTRFIYEVTEPVLGFFRSKLRLGIPLDISPVLAIMALELVERILYRIVLYI